VGSLVITLREEEAAVFTDADGAELASILFVRKSNRRGRFVVDTSDGVEVHRRLGPEFRPRLAPGPKVASDREAREALAVGPGPAPAAPEDSRPPDPTPVAAAPRRPLGRHMERAIEEAERRDRDANRRERNR
jgi:hypothetical protein